MSEYTDRARALDLATGLAANGRILPEKVIETAKSYVEFLVNDTASDSGKDS
jgi:hypothetical protein